MNAENSPGGFSATQIILHWTIAGLIVLQLLLGEEIKPAYRAFNRGSEPVAGELFSANLHVYVGLAVLALAILRFAIRLRRGVPDAPAGESALVRRVAAATHFVLYLFIFGMPVTGALAWYLGLRSVGEVHELAKPFIIVAVSLHAAAALWQHFFVKSDVLVRMLKPMPRRTLS